MNYVIGIDGGGTKTHLRLAAASGELIAEVFGEASNLGSNSQTAVTNNLEQLVKNGLALAPGTLGECAAVCLGTAGISMASAPQILRNILLRATGCQNVTVVGDHELLLCDEAEKNPVVLVIAGTGAICYGKKDAQTTVRSSGWGHLVGDEGGAYYIAARGLQKALKAYDHRAEKNTMLSYFFRQLGVSTVQELISYIYDGNTKKQQIAELAKAVDAAAKDGDFAAQSVLADAANELVDSCVAVIKSIEVAEKPFTVLLSGSVMTKNLFVRNAFEERISNLYSRAQIREPQRDAAWGAVKIALDSLKG